MTEPQLFQINCARTATGSSFSGGVQIFPFSVGHPYAWLPSKSYFLIKATLSNLAGTAPLLPSAMTTFADNVGGNLWDNVYLQAGSTSISQITQYASQVSALDVRLNSPYSKLKSLGSSALANEASFAKRLNASSSWAVGTAAAPALGQASPTGLSNYEGREIYRPFLAASVANYATMTVLVTTAGVVTGSAAGTDFLNGMPLGSAPVGGSVLPGDILVVNGIPFTITTGAAAITATNAYVQCAPTTTAIAATADWFIVRADTIRTPISSNSVEVVWRPPIGIMKCDKPFGAGQFQFVMSPNSNYIQSAVETKNANWATTLPYKFNIDEVFLYVWMEKMSIPEAPVNLFFNEYNADVRAYSSNVNIEVSPSTTALTIFVQDNAAGTSPLMPPSMFKSLTNADLYLKTIQVQYGGINKPVIPWESKYQAATNGGTYPLNNYINQLQQRYRDSYEESGMDIESGGCETFEEWMKRGPFYHFSFERDMSNRSTTVQVNLTFNEPGNTGLSNTARVFIVSHKTTTCQMVTNKGVIASIVVADV